MKLAIPGIYPPFLMKKGTAKTKAMEDSGISSSDFFMNLKNSEINLPLKMIIKNEQSNYNFFHENNVEFNFKAVSLAKHMNVTCDNANIYIKHNNNNLPSSDGDCRGECNCDLADGCEDFNTDEKKEINRFRHPETLDDYEIQHMTGMNIRKFKTFCQLRKDNCVSCKELGYNSQCLMYLAYYRKGLSIRDLALFWSIPHTTVERVLNNLLYKELQKNQHIPFLCNSDTQLEVNRTMNFLKTNIPPFLNCLIDEFEDPKGEGRECVAASIDATYFKVEKSGKSIIYIFKSDFKNSHEPINKKRYKMLSK